MTGTSGPALGVLSTDIGVSENSSTPVGNSLQLSGTGAQYADFAWLAPDVETPGNLNNGQTFGAAATPTHLAVTSVNGGASPLVNTAFDVVVQAQDNTNTPANVTSNVNITLTLATGTGLLGGTLTGTILSGSSSITITGVTYNTAETGISITASDDAAGLTAGTSALFEVVSTATVTSISQLRAGVIGNPYFLSTEVVLTFQQSFRNQKFIQDLTGGILIDDSPGTITTVYAVGDGITGITGTLGEYGGMLQFIPTADPGPATTGFTITPQVITLNDLTTNFESYESELVTINGLTFTDAGLTFANGTEYGVSDASGPYIFRTTFYSVDYIGGIIPTTVDLTCIPNSRTTGDYITARSLADFSYGGLPVITKAFAINSTDVDVYYNVGPSSVNSGDYYILGTTTTTFAAATIDGTDPNLVHLTGASPAMTGDLTVDELFDDAYGSSYVFYAGILPIAYTNLTNPGGTMSNDTMATFQGIVSANDAFNTTWVSDAAGQYNGVMVYGSSFMALAAQGDEVRFASTKTIFNNQTELNNPNFISTISTGNTPYGPDIILGSDIEETIPAETAPAESWEGQLVKIENFSVESYGLYDYKCSWVDGSSITHYFHVGDNVDYHFGTISMTVGSSYSAITGVVDWDPDSTFYRINPRTQADVEVSVNPAVKLAIVSVNGGVNPYTSTNFSVTVQAQDASNNPALVSADVNFTFTTNGGVSTNVAFVGGTSTTGTILNGTSEIIVSGVQMAPAGTGVTITASDDNSFNGLTSGTSSAFDVVDLVIPEIMITEIMQNPSAVSDNMGEWFEVYNMGTSDVDMNGWLLKDDGSNSHTIASSVIVPAGAFAVLGNNGDLLTNGGVPVDYVYTGFYLSNGADEVVLLLPDGVTEIDRVNYDGGAVWPDPSGSSMTYTGFPNEDNNDGTKWVWATFRENNYDNSSTDKGSPGANGYDQILTGGFKLDLKVYLENAFVNADSMSNYFRANSMLPLYQPFNPALPYFGNNTPSWLYSGTDTLSYIPFLTTNWVLVELRDATSAASATSATMLAQYPALVSDTGVVVSMNGEKPLNVNIPFSNNMYIVVWSLNHLGMMSANGSAPVDGTVVSYDFSTGSAQVYGGAAGAKELSTGVWGMMSGDVNGDQTVDGSDLSNGWAIDAGLPGIYQGDNLYLDDQIDNRDKDEFIAPNMGMSSQVPN